MKKFVTAFIALLTALNIAAMLPACDFGGDNSTGGDTTQNGDNTTNNGNQNQNDDNNTDNDSDEPVTQYSGILNAVLNSDYYDGVLENYREQNKNRTTNLESPIPYTFLEREGYDIEKIKSGELSCETVAYIMDGDTTRLYISTQPESPAGYYGNYILSYPLTQQEYEDLYMLHREEYIQAGLFIQELDAQKRATVESHIDVEKETFEGIENGFKGLAEEHAEMQNATIDVIHINPNDLEFTVNVRERHTDFDPMIHSSELYTVDCYSFPLYFEYETDYLKLSNPSRYGLRDIEQFQTKAHDLTYFDSQGKPYPNLSFKQQIFN